jgi:predicted nuclease with TOPRIM domain
MWTEEKQTRFDDLWRRKFEGSLAEAEQQDLALLLEELDREEEERLRPAMERMDREIEAGQERLEAIQSENTTLEAIIAKRESLLDYARTILA